MCSICIEGHGVASEGLYESPGMVSSLTAKLKRYDVKLDSVTLY